MGLYTKAVLAKKQLKELRELAGEHGIDIDGLDKAGIVNELLEVQEDDELDEELEDEVDLEDEEEELEDEEDLDEELEEDEVEEAPAKKTTKKPATKAATKKPAADGEETLAAKQVATILGTEAKTLRQFLRSSASTFEAVGSGGRYEFTKGDVDNIKKEFDAWRSAHAARGSKRGPSAGKGTKAAVNAEEIEEVEEIEELEEELDLEIDEEELELEDED